MAKEQDKENNEIPGMDLQNKYSSKNDIIPQDQQKVKKELEKTKKELEKIKAFIMKKYPFTISLSLLPPKSIKFFIDEEEIPKETEKIVHLYMIIPENKFKEIPKIKTEIVKELEKLKQKTWIQIKTPIDVWEICLDSKFELFSAIAMSFPLQDKEFLSSLRLAEIHKSLVLQKFEKYVVSYVIGGSFVRGDVVKTSDLDVFIVINDTDVKKMPRLELLERLRGIIYQYISEAYALAGIKKNILNVQVYLLTDFWQSVKDANPVMFTFIRDGIPIYDRGTFMPWKALLKMGKLKPSPEAIDMFMSMGDKVVERAKKTMLDILMGDIYWGINTPSQALLMLYGLPPPNVKETAKEFRKIFVEKEKMLEKKYADFLEEIIIKYYKGYEHGKIKEISGAELDKILKNAEDFLKRLKELRKQIEKRAQEKTIEQVYSDVFGLLKAIFGNQSQAKIIESFEKQLVKTGKMPKNHLKILKNIILARTQFKRGKLDIHKTEEARKEASLLMNDLIEYSQRKEFISIEKGRMRIKYKIGTQEETADLLTANGQTFFITKNTIKKIIDKIMPSNSQEVSRAVENQKGKKTVEINQKVFDMLKEEIGNFQIVL